MKSFLFFAALAALVLASVAYPAASYRQALEYSIAIDASPSPDIVIPETSAEPSDVPDFGDKERDPFPDPDFATEPDVGPAKEASPCYMSHVDFGASKAMRCCPTSYPCSSAKCASASSCNDPGMASCTITECKEVYLLASDKSLMEIPSECRPGFYPVN